MRFYFISDTRTPAYRATLREAHAVAKTMPNQFDVRIELVEIPTDQASLVLLLNGEPVTQTALRNWELTPRGGLNEIPLEN